MAPHGLKTEIGVTPCAILRIRVRSHFCMSTFSSPGTTYVVGNHHPVLVPSFDAYIGTRGLQLPSLCACVWVTFMPEKHDLSTVS